MPNKSVYLKYWLILISILLVLIDSIISLVLRGKLKINTKIYKNIFSFAFILILPSILFNQNIEASEEISALNPSLGFIETKVSEIDLISEAGLLSLGKVLEKRTSILLGPPKKINIEKDNISFFPLIYWPIHIQSRIISTPSVVKIQNYIENGGLIVFDTRDANPSKIINNQVSDEQKILRQILKPLDLPALIPVPKDHVLRRSFYLLNQFPGRWNGEQVWVEATSENSKDGVSSVIIGRHDWAAAWAKVDSRPIMVVVPGGEKQREYSYRFGVNLVMYSMTGNYKADQVHIKSILKRLQNMKLDKR